MKPILCVGHGKTVVAWDSEIVTFCPVCKAFEDNAEVIRELKEKIRDLENDLIERDS